MYASEGHEDIDQPPSEDSDVRGFISSSVVSHGIFAVEHSNFNELIREVFSC